MLYRIGEFSKLTDASIRTLRYYDEIDLFKPKEIDLFTGYRYYSKEQIEDFNLIKTLQEVGFSLEEIKDNWGNFNDSIMLDRKEKLKIEMETEERLLLEKGTKNKEKHERKEEKER